MRLDSVHLCCGHLSSVNCPSDGLLIMSAVFLCIKCPNPSFLFVVVCCFKSWCCVTVYLTVLGLSGSTWGPGCIIQGLLCGATDSRVAAGGLSGRSAGTPEHTGFSSGDTRAR